MIYNTAVVHVFNSSNGLKNIRMPKGKYIQDYSTAS